MQATTSRRLLAVLGVLLACSCWFTSLMFFGAVMGESFSADPAEQARIASSKQLWTVVLLSAWLFSLVASSAIAGIVMRTNRVLAALTWTILLAFIVFAVYWSAAV